MTTILNLDQKQMSVSYYLSDIIVYCAPVSWYDLKLQPSLLFLRYTVNTPASLLYHSLFLHPQGSFLRSLRLLKRDTGSQKNYKEFSFEYLRVKTFIKFSGEMLYRPKHVVFRSETSDRENNWEGSENINGITMRGYDWALVHFTA